MSVAYRQPILPGQVGKDVKAVKRAFVAMHQPGSGAMVISTTAGQAFVNALKAFQRAHHLHVDGIYGPSTHALVAPHFDLYGDYLYRTAAIRQAPHPPDPINETAIKLALRLVELEKTGEYHADNPGDWPQIVATSEGKPVWSPMGRYVYLDHKPLAAIVWLIDVKGYRIGTYALCSDHGYDSPLGHAGGHCVDISSIDGVSIASYSIAARKNTIAVGRLLHDWVDHPVQLISGGYGNARDSACSANCLPAADSYYGSQTMQQHTNHIHVGY